MQKIRFFIFHFSFFIFLALSPFRSQALSDKIYRELDTFSRIIDIVDRQYVDPLDEHLLIEGAIRGMLSALDPHTMYLPPEIYQDFQSDTTGQFGGIGIEITVKDGVLTVVAPLEDSPAFSAGIRSGDRIVKIDGEPAKQMSLIEAVHRMRGPRGKKVILTVFREGGTQPVDIAVVRDIIKIRSIKSELVESQYGYLRITSFQEKTSEELRKAIRDLEEKSGKKLMGIVLDLRDNPGGLLTEAIKVADLFVEKGVIVSTRGRNRESEERKAADSSPYEATPMVVLVNRGSASASEIVAGALQDLRRAKILGTTSFGKGTVQTLIEIGDKAALKITIARYYTPKGRSIDGKGIVPDVEIGQDQFNKEHPKKEGEKRPELLEFQKKKAFDYLKKTL